MEYVTFQDLHSTVIPGGEGETEHNVPLLEENDMSLLQSPTSSPHPLTGHAVGRKISLTTISLVILCVFLAVGLVVVTLKYTRNNSDHNKGNSKRFDGIPRHFLQISDTHLDIYYDSNVTNKFYQGCRNVKSHKNNETVGAIKSKTTAVFGRFQCDSPPYLMMSVQKQIAKIAKELENGIDFALLTGDQVAHGYEFFDVDVLQSVLWSIGNSSKMVADSLPGVPLIMAIGNNDLKIDYEPPVSNYSSFYRSLYPIFLQYLLPQDSQAAKENSKEEFRKTFELGGYYSVLLNDRKLLVIVLNTDYWSSKAYKRNTNVTIIGNIQMKWLHEQLQKAEKAKQRVFIAGHIPPGIDSYNGKSSWILNYTNIYTLMTTLTFKHIIAGQLYGHIHQDKIKLQYHSDKYFDDADKSFILTCPSVTPIYGSNPGFRVYDYNQHKQTLLDYTQYYLDLPVSNVVKKEGSWRKEYSFVDQYSVDLSMEGVERIVDNLLDPTLDTWFKYLSHMKTSMEGYPSYKRYAEYCASKYFTEHRYQQCMKKYKDADVGMEK